MSQSCQIFTKRITDNQQLRPFKIAPMVVVLLRLGLDARHFQSALHLGLAWQQQ